MGVIPRIATLITWTLTQHTRKIEHFEWLYLTGQPKPTERSHMPPKKLARLVPPHADKNWSFQAINLTEDDVYKIRAAFPHAAVQPASPFLQGNSGGWAMVEFWTKDKKVIDTAAKHLFDVFRLPVVEGDFTRKDLGLE